MFDNKITRRAFNKRIIALAAPANLLGCSKLIEPTATVQEIQEEERIFSGCSAHNCKGRCITKIHVINNSIRRITTDARPESYDMPQMRACLRCRSYKARVHHSGRLIYPLIYDEKASKRGDVTKFRRVTWKEAIDYIKRKYNGLRSKYPAECVYKPSGSGGTIGKINGNVPIDRVLNGLGGFVGGWGGYSYHALNHISPIVAGKDSYHTFGTTPENWMYTKTMLMWGVNTATSGTATNAVWWLTQARENGMKSYYINPIYENTGELADEWVPIKPGTDGALMLAMIHEMIVNEWLDYDSIENFSVGFFDDVDGVKPEIISETREYLKVPAGMSLSAYIMGNQKLERNQVSCGYKSKSKHTTFSFKTDFNVRKTPEWAEKITGVPAAKIREIAKTYCTQKPAMIYASLGLQRQNAGVDNVWLCYALALVSGNWGTLGAGVPCYYVMSDNLIGTGDIHYEEGINPLTRPMRFSNTLWTDAVRSKGTGASKYGDAEIEAMTTPIKIIFAHATNTLVNQHMDPFTSIELLEDRGNVELIVVMDNFMTPSAKFADVILPCTTHHEHEDIILYHNNLIYQSQAIKATGEVKSLYDIGEMLADAFELKTKNGKNLVTEDKTVSQWVKEMYEGEVRTLSFENFKKEGVYTNKTQGVLSGSIDIRAHGKCDSKINFGTRTGYIELYSKAVVEEYENRGKDIGGTGHKNIDTERDPEVYPIPKYLPFIDEYKQTILKNVKISEYPFHCLGNHSLFRTHSSNANNPMLRELYKVSADGMPKFDSNHAVNLFDVNYDADGSYEPVYINPRDAAKVGVKDGMRVKITSGMTKKTIYAVAKTTVRCMEGVVVVCQGAWFDPIDMDGVKIDQGGCNSTLISEQPTRNDKGPAMMSAIVKIERSVVKERVKKSL